MQKTYTENTIQTTLDLGMSQKSTPKTYPTLTSWLEDSLVKHFLLQDREEGLMTAEELSSLKSLGFSKTKDPNIFYLKMFEVYYLTTREKLSRQFLKSSPTWGIMLNGRYLILPISEFHREESEYSLKDILEKDVEEKYYISESTLKNLLVNE